MAAQNSHARRKEALPISPSGRTAPDIPRRDPITEVALLEMPGEVNRQGPVPSPPSVPPSRSPTECRPSPKARATRSGAGYGCGARGALRRSISSRSMLGDCNGFFERPAKGISDHPDICLFEHPKGQTMRPHLGIYAA